MGKTCSECTHLEATDSYGPDIYGKYWCSKNLEGVLATKEECWRFTPAYSRDSSKSESMYDLSAEKSKDSSCFITTICCDILGMSDDNVYLNTLRLFRNAYMRSSSKRQSLLVKYDVVGPKIAKCISENENKEQLALHLFENYILVSCNQIMNKDLQAAEYTYISMVNFLMEDNNIGTMNSSNKLMPYSKVKKMGHGRSNY